MLLTLMSNSSSPLLVQPVPPSRVNPFSTPSTAGHVGGAQGHVPQEIALEKRAGPAELDLPGAVRLRFGIHAHAGKSERPGDQGVLDDRRFAEKVDLEAERLEAVVVDDIVVDARGPDVLVNLDGGIDRAAGPGPYRQRFPWRTGRPARSPPASRGLASQSLSGGPGQSPPTATFRRRWKR